MVKLQVYTFGIVLPIMKLTVYTMNLATKSEVAGDFMVLGFRFRVEVSRVGSLWFGMGGLGFRDWGLGFRGA